MTTHGVLRQRQESNDSMQNPTARKHQHAHTIKVPRQQQYHRRRELKQQRHTRSRPQALRNTRHKTATRRNNKKQQAKFASKKRSNQRKMCNGKWRKEKWRRTMMTPKQKNFWQGKGTNERRQNDERKMTWKKNKIKKKTNQRSPCIGTMGSMKLFIIMNSKRLRVRNCAMSRWGEHENTSRITQTSVTSWNNSTNNYAS